MIVHGLLRVSYLGLTTKLTLTLKISSTAVASDLGFFILWQLFTEIRAVRCPLNRSEGRFGDYWQVISRHAPITWAEELPNTSKDWDLEHFGGHKDGRDWNQMVSTTALLSHGDLHIADGAGSQPCFPIDPIQEGPFVYAAINSFRVLRFENTCCLSRINFF